jgi:pSer/pThr/pTyr-binding forkhead associated (FHA) protein
MSYVFCNQCGHRNPPGANFCSSCGAILDLADDRTVVIAQIDPMQDAPGTNDNATIRLGDVTGHGVLVVRSGDLTGARFTLSKPITRIGRGPDSDILFDDITVSRSHAEVFINEGGLFVRDLGSLNGTYVNRVIIEKASLVHGDELQVGKFHMILFSKADKI